MKKLLQIICLAAVTLVCASQLSAHQSINVRRGLQALEQGDLEVAEAELQQARFADPENPTIAYNLGIVNYRKREFARAAQHFMHAAAAAPEDQELRFNSLYNLGNSAFKAGDYAAAISAYNGGLELKKDFQAEFNLKVAEEKLKKQQEKQQEQQKQQQDQQGQQNKDDKDQEQQKDKSQQGQEQNQDGQKNEKSGDQSDDKDNKQQQQAGNKDDQKQQNGDQQANSDQKSDENKDAQQPGDKDKESDDSKQKQQQADSGNQQNASQTQQLNEQAGKDDQKERQDVEMAQPDPEKAPQKPEASQRARALKNSKVNPYMVEKILKDMENREVDAQLRARNEGVRSDDEDPFAMDSDQLRNWFENRGRPQNKPTDEPDW